MCAGTSASSTISTACCILSKVVFFLDYYLRCIPFNSHRLALHNYYNPLARSLLRWVLVHAQFPGDSVSTDLISLPNQQELNWPTTLAMVALHLGAIAALFMFS